MTKPTPIRASSLLTVTRADIPSLVNNWGFVRKGLLKIKQNLVDSTWIPEQIRRELERGILGQGGAETFFCSRGDRLIGFYVMLPQVDPWLQVPLHWLMWLVYAKEPMWDEVIPEVEKQARERGYAGLDFITSLPELLEKGKKHGFERVNVTARKRLDYNG